MSDQIPTSFLNYAAEILADTSKGLSGIKIVEYSNAWAFDCDVDLPHSSYPFDAPNKRTALQQNLAAFAPKDQYSFLLDLCDRFSSPRSPEIDKLRTIIVERFEQLFADESQNKRASVTTLLPVLGPTNSISLPKGRLLKVFLCHASDDKLKVRRLYKKLKENGIDPWLDEKDLVAGQDWQFEIKQAVKTTDVVLVCLSKSSITKKGYVQKEIRIALDVAEEQPEGNIFIIPVRLENCTVPDRLLKWQWVNEFEANGYKEISRALRKRATSLEQDVVTPPLFSNSNVVQKREIVSLDPSLTYIEGWQAVKKHLANQLQKEFGNIWSVNIIPLPDEIRSKIEEGETLYPEVIRDEGRMIYFARPEPLSGIQTIQATVMDIYDFVLQAEYPDES